MIFSYFLLAVRTRSPILDLRRAMLSIARLRLQPPAPFQGDPRAPGQNSLAEIDRQIGRCWLESARVARECGLIQTAHSSLLSAAQYEGLPELCLERARWLWDKGDCDLARACLERELCSVYADRWDVLILNLLRVIEF